MALASSRVLPCSLRLQPLAQNASLRLALPAACAPFEEAASDGALSHWQLRLQPARCWPELPLQRAYCVLLEGSCATDGLHRAVQPVPICFRLVGCAAARGGSRVAYTPLRLVAHAPEAPVAPLAASLLLSFNQPVQPGSGALWLRRIVRTHGLLFEVDARKILASEAQFNSNEMTVSVSSDVLHLDPRAEYWVEVEKTFVKNEAWESLEENAECNFLLQTLDDQCVTIGFHTEGIAFCRYDWSNELKRCICQYLFF